MQHHQQVKTRQNKTKSKLLSCLCHQNHHLCHQSCHLCHQSYHLCLSQNSQRYLCFERVQLGRSCWEARSFELEHHYLNRALGLSSSVSAHLFLAWLSSLFCWASLTAGRCPPSLLLPWVFWIWFSWHRWSWAGSGQSASHHLLSCSSWISSPAQDSNRCQSQGFHDFPLSSWWQTWCPPPRGWKALDTQQK